MEINVQGMSTKKFIPDLVILDLDFYVKDQTYDKVLKVGTTNVLIFMDKILFPNGFQKEDLKTREFVIKEEKKYDEITKNYLFDGYSYTQKAVLQFPYDRKLFASLMVEISKLNNYPQYNIKFGMQDDQRMQNEVLALSFQNAQERAEVLANEAKKSLKQCMEIKDYNDNLKSYSRSSYPMFLEDTMGSGEDIIETVFTPEEVTITKTVTTKWETD